MSIIYQERASDTPYVETITPGRTVSNGSQIRLRTTTIYAGEKNIGVGGPNFTRQCLRLGILDEIHIDLVSVLLGQGARLFEHLGI